MKTLNIGGIGQGKRHQHIYKSTHTLDINAEDEFRWDLNYYPYPFVASAWDFVFCSHVLEHLDNPQKALCEIVRISKEALIYVPHRWSRLGRCDKRPNGHKSTFTTLWFCKVLNQLPVLYSVNLSWGLIRPLDLEIHVIKNSPLTTTCRNQRA